MTPTAIIDAARRAFNVNSSDTFFSDAQFYEWIHAAEMELATKAKVIEAVYTTTTVAGTQEYAYPTNAFAIKKVTYDGKPLEDITFKDDDLMTGGDQDLTTRGTPLAYVDFGQTFYLRPLPDAAQTLKVWGYVHPSGVPTATYVMEVPDDYHIKIVDFLLSRMAAKSKDYEGAQFYQGKWEQTVADAIRFQQRKRRGASFRTVANVDVLPQAITGTI